MKYTVEDVKKLGTILGIWAHPDDEVFSCAGLMRAASSNGQKIISITATYGDAGQSADESKWPKANLAEIRRQESDAALRAIGTIEQHWLGYKDGCLSDVSVKEAVEKIRTIVDGQKIDTIITFEENGITGHEDHKTVHIWANELAEKLKVKYVLYAVENAEFYESHGKKLHEKHNIYFNVDAPHAPSKDAVDVCFKLSKSYRQNKLSALRKHASQTAQLLSSDEGQEALNTLVECECFEQK